MSGEVWSYDSVKSKYPEQGLKGAALENWGEVGGGVRGGVVVQLCKKWDEKIYKNYPPPL